MIPLLRSLISNPTVRTYFLKTIRHFASFAAGYIAAQLAQAGINVTDSVAVSQAVAELIIAVGGAAYGTIADGKSVSGQVAAAKADGQETAVQSIAANLHTITAPSGSPEALAQLRAILAGGQA